MSFNYIGFDVHKKSISYCVKTVADEIVKEGKLAADRASLREWAEKQTHPWRGAALESNWPRFMPANWNVATAIGPP